MIPFRPHHSWWGQVLLLIWRWTPELLLLAAVVWYWHRTSEAGWPTPTQIAVPMALLAPVVIWPRAGEDLAVARRLHEAYRLERATNQKG